MISFDVTDEQLELICKIAKRADYEIFSVTRIEQTVQDTTMDLCACIAQGCELQLQELLDADMANFVHDVLGIRRHINRETGEIENCFLPRFAK